jgi:hypothetical protein
MVAVFGAAQVGASEDIQVEEVGRRVSGRVRRPNPRVVGPEWCE